MSTDDSAIKMRRPSGDAAHDMEAASPTPMHDDSSDDSRSAKPLTAHEKFLSLLQRDARGMEASGGYTLFNQCIAELFGTMFIVLFGVGSVCSAVLLKKDVDLWHVTSVWGFGVALAILVSVQTSGAHLNPAVSLAMALFRPRDFPFSKLLPYWGAQYLGGILGGAFNLMIFGPMYRHFETVNNISRGDARSVVTASTFGEYFPPPKLDEVGNLSSLGSGVVSVGFALLVEAWATGILTLVIFSLTDSRQKFIRNSEMVPFYIGFTVAILMTMYTPITMGGFNPARDFGPRLVAAMAGWGKIALPGPRNGFWIYVIGPKLGAVVGAFTYDCFLRPGIPA